jgi:anaerobic selenocysteine-containing dehydrogenase
MTQSLSRREFLKIAAGTTGASGLAPQAQRFLLQPFSRPPEESLTG